MSDHRRARQRLEISRAAIRLFREHGVAATSGEQIAEAVGLSARTFWRWFRTKESCVEPVLSLSTDAFTACLRRWPADRSLEEHLLGDFAAHDDSDPGDGELALAVVRMSHDDLALRAIWLVVQERAEPVLAGILADRLGRGPGGGQDRADDGDRADGGDRAGGDAELRVQAAALNAALRIATEDIAAATADGHEPPVRDLAARLSTAVRAATRGVPGGLAH